LQAALLYAFYRNTREIKLMQKAEKNESSRGETTGYLKAEVLLLVIPVLKSTYCWLAGNHVVLFENDSGQAGMQLLRLHMFTGTNYCDRF